MRQTVRVAVVVVVLGVIATFAVLFVRPGEPRLASPSPTPQGPVVCPAVVGPTGDYCYPNPTGIGDAIRPRSGSAVPGRWYDIEIGHCGLDWIVDFSGSFWEVVRWDTADPPSSLINGDRGRIRLTADGEAEYAGSQGEHVVLRRIEGPGIVDLTQPR